MKCLEDKQTSLTAFVSKTSDNDKYSSCHHRQRAITSAIVSDLIIDCSLPLRLVENPSFRHFLEVLNKYSHVSRSTVTSTISDMATSMQEKIKIQLASATKVSVTVDIWSDRKMRGFLGVTVHMMEISKTSIQMQSRLLCCNRFTGKHTGERISEKFESVCTEYQIKNKIDYIISDNAANMRKAFTVCFPSSDDIGTDASDVESNTEPLDDDDMWEDLPENDSREVHMVLSGKCRKQQLACFAHTLQLVVSDGLKQTRCIRPALSKTSRLCTLLHTSCNFKEAFEKVFGANKGITADVCTRWHSTLRQVKSVVRLGKQPLSDLAEAEGHKEVQFTQREWNQLEELVLVMDPFYDATVLAQGETTAAISVVLPSVLSLYHHVI